MSLDISKKIILNTNNDKPNGRIIIKQGNIDTITLIVSINDKGGILELPPGTTAKVRMLKPNKKQVLNDCEVAGNNIYISITQQMQASAGEGQCEVVLFSGGKTFTSATFPITIEPQVHDDSQIESTAEYNALLNALVRIEDAIPKAEQAYTVAMQAQEIVDDIQEEFEQMQTDNANAINAANTATANASSKASLANDAAINANTKATLANDAAVSATNAAGTANAAATNANEKAALANTAAINANNANQQVTQAEAERVAFYNAYKVCEPYDNDKNYVPGNKVLYQGSTYQNISPCKGILPNNSTNWIVIAAKGLDGEGSGDMVSSIYDPQGRSQDIYAYADNVAKDKLDKTGDSKDNTVTFSETSEDVDILSGESHSTIFGKILKSIKTLRSGKINKSDITNQTETDDENKVSSSKVTHYLQDQVTTLNDNLTVVTGGTIPLNPTYFSSGAITYKVKSGVCYVDVEGVCATGWSDDIVISTDSLPLPKNGDAGFVITNPYGAARYAIIAADGKLYMNNGVVSLYMRGSCAYIVA